ncbi:MAG: holo-ACP synthase [candidate division NC10 bacterium]|nr:holo-ACP synthase [candidate division NC10 bacterium]
MVISIGVDLVSIARMEEALGRWQDRLLGRVFTRAEAAFCQGRAYPAAHLAARLAAKEAAFKALGTGWGQGVRWLDVEVATDRAGGPRLLLQGRAGELAQGKGIKRTFLSLAHEGEYALAFVVATD